MRAPLPRSAPAGLLLAVLLSAPATADGFYLGARAASADVDGRVSILELDDGDAGVLEDRGTDEPLLGVFGGIPINRHLSVELGWWDLGTTEALFDPGPLCESLVPRDTLHQLEATAFTGHAVVRLPTPGGLFTAGAKIGLALPDPSVRQTQTFTDTSVAVDLNGDLELAIGAMLEIDPRGPLSFRLDYDHIPVTDSVNADLVSFALVWWKP